MTYLSRDEFGQTLYQAVALFAGRDQVRRYYRLTVTDLRLTAPARKRKLDDLKQREADLTKQILDLMPSVPPEDQRELLARYEHG